VLTAHPHAADDLQPVQPTVLCVRCPALYRLAGLTRAADWLYPLFEYFKLIESAFEGIVLASFLMLLIAYISKVDGGLKHEQIVRKERHRIPMPFCCITYSPRKPAFQRVLHFVVLQYGVVRFLNSIAGCVAASANVLCPDNLSPQFAALWLEIIDCASVRYVLLATA
jgi:hypothetical protein